MPCVLWLLRKYTRCLLDISTLSNVLGTSWPACYWNWPICLPDYCSILSTDNNLSRSHNLVGYGVLVIKHSIMSVWSSSRVLVVRYKGILHRTYFCNSYRRTLGKLAVCYIWMEPLTRGTSARVNQESELCSVALWQCSKATAGSHGFMLVAWHKLV